MLSGIKVRAGRLRSDSLACADSQCALVPIFRRELETVMPGRGAIRLN
jgi:hypothetical protein